eukprot:TRINITY_DN1338_c2_g1_i4.p1 TRINITY_DN1338_c2_g1~~TRINITY_DN1338_c2_g1_i4.p1  ORF type:complete len:142 (+),score=44.27 TRINITY_DN1338_c2_g1_i4:28-453(+)
MANFDKSEIDSLDVDIEGTTEVVEEPVQETAVEPETTAAGEEVEEEEEFFDGDGFFEETRSAEELAQEKQLQDELQFVIGADECVQNVNESLRVILDRVHTMGDVVGKTEGLLDSWIQLFSQMKDHQDKITNPQWNGEVRE